MKKEIEDVIGLDTSNAILASAKKVTASPAMTEALLALAARVGKIAGCHASAAIACIQPVWLLAAALAVH